jgi:hypothetical protein
MRELYRNLYVGSDDDYEKVKKDSSWFIIRACKEGPGGHRDFLGYTTQGASKDKNYLSVKKGNVLALNLIDSPDPNYIPDALINTALTFIKECLGANRKVLVACNHGKSRAPGIIFLYLYSTGKLPSNYHQAVKIFRQIYPNYNPGIGMELYLRRRVREIKTLR